MSGFLVNTPRCFVDIYPWEGGPLNLTGNSAGLLSCTTSKGINTDEPGSFTLTLAPGGPFGPNGRPQWLEVLTPMSLCVIGMQRGGIRQIVMAGVVIAVNEPQEFQNDQTVTRAITVSGVDMQYFFTQRNFYALNLLASFGQTIFAAAPAGALAQLSDGLLLGPPEAVGYEWFYKIMAGTKGLLANTSFAYLFGRATFNSLISTKFESYPAELDIPYGDFFMVNEGTWMFKFRQFFPEPWYEFFVTTAPPAAYPISKGLLLPVPATNPITMAGFDSATVALVARVNPFPYLEHMGSSTATTTAPNLRLNYTYWNRLVEYAPDAGGTIGQQLVFNDGLVRNFYILNPRASLLYGQSNAALAPFVYTFAAWADPASINRYGYRPQIAEVHWLSDLKGKSAQTNAAEGRTEEQFSDLITALALKQVSFFQPTPLMAQASVTINLRPDILAGNKFTFQPFKDLQKWTFYIDGVSHSYAFGRSATTTLSLSRGLPSDVYANDTLLTAIYTGNASRLSGQYVATLPTGTGKGLQPVNLNSMQGLLGQIIQTFQTPGAS